MEKSPLGLLKMKISNGLLKILKQIIRQKIENWRNYCIRHRKKFTSYAKLDCQRDSQTLHHSSKYFVFLSLIPHNNLILNISNISSLFDCREKMAFFTRKGLAVPDLPSDFVLTEEPEEFSMPATPPSSTSNSTPNEATPNPTEDGGDQAKSANRFDYTVDRNYGVEVWFHHSHTQHAHNPSVSVRVACVCMLTEFTVQIASNVYRTKWLLGGSNREPTKQISKRIRSYESVRIRVACTWFGPVHGKIKWVNHCGHAQCIIANFEMKKETVFYVCINHEIK